MSAKDLLDLDEELYHSSDSDEGRSKTFSRTHDSDSEDEPVKGRKRAKLDSAEEESDENDIDLDEEEGQDEDAQDIDGLQEGKAEPLSVEEMEARMKAIQRSGVVYLSSVPPYMKPVKLRQVLARFGQVNRIFMAPEDPAVHTRRVRAGGNRKKKYTEGWVEFVRKKDAKVAADTLNGNKLGGRKGNFYYDDIMNVKYLKRFKWTDLTEQIALEAAERQEKMKAEIALATKENKIFIENVERKAMIDKIEEKKGKKQDDVRRTFSQRPSQKPKPKSDMSNVLSSIF